MSDIMLQESEQNNSRLYINAIIMLSVSSSYHFSFFMFQSVMVTPMVSPSRPGKHTDQKD